MTQIQIAQHLGITEAAVSMWKKKLTEEGPQALKLHKATGRPPKLGKSEMQRMLEILNKGTRAAGFLTEFWNQGQVRKLIQQEFGEYYNHSSIYQLLKELGWRIEKPDLRVIVLKESISYDNIIMKFRRSIKFRVIGRKNNRRK
jgi:transposase